MLNDKKIEDHKKSIENKIEELGVCPKSRYQTNGVLYVNGKDHNLNILGSVESCVNLVDQIVKAVQVRRETNKILSVNVPVEFGGHTADQYIEDIKLVLEVIQWKAENKKLNKALKSLSGLLSEDAKTSSAIDDIAADLGL